jgi:nucleotide-binding universal stress UspA family protein
MKILLAVDRVDSVNKGCKLVGGLMQAWPQAELIVVHVSDIKVPFYQRTTLGLKVAIPPSERAAVENVEKKVTEYFYPWQDRVDFRHLIGDPKTAICDVVSNEDVDLVIMGSCKRKTLFGRRVHQEVLGSVSAPVLLSR